MAEVFNIKIDRDTLHDRLNGGIPKGSITLMEGEDGSGKSILSQRLLYGFLVNGYRVTYISTELTTKGFLDQMRSLNYEVLNYMISRQLLFVPVYPLIGRPRDKSDFLERLMSAKEIFKSDIIIIDTFSGLSPEDVSVADIMKVIYFFKKIVSKNKAIILTVDHNHIAPVVLKHLRNTADVYLQLITNVTEGEISRIIVVRRFSYAVDFVSSVTGFRVEPQVGVIVDITTVA